MLRCSAALNCNTVQGQTAFSWERIDLLVSSHHYWVFLNVPRPRRATLSRVQSIQSIFRFSARLTVTRPAILGGRPAGQTLFSRSIPCLFLNVSLEKKDLNKKRTSEGGAQVAKGRKEGRRVFVRFRAFSLSLSLSLRDEYRSEVGDAVSDTSFGLAANAAEVDRQVHNKTLGSGPNGRRRIRPASASATGRQNEFGEYMIN